MSLAPSPERKVPFVEISTWSRRPLIAPASTSSEAPPEYTSAESNIVTPASRQMSTSRVASLTSLAPQAPKNSPLPPNVPVPNVSAGTLKPELPSLRYSMVKKDEGRSQDTNRRIANAIPFKPFAAGRHLLSYG